MNCKYVYRQQKLDDNMKENTQAILNQHILHTKYAINIQVGTWVPIMPSSKISRGIIIDFCINIQVS